MILQVIVGVLLLQLQVLNPDDADDAERYGCCYKDENKKRKFRWTLDRINNLTLCLIFFILLCNTVISGVGVDFFGALPGSANETK
ncbi:hypothetical protein BaRGS_00022449 [Batillaria attramentaria]|uniref:Uncharacterized protein n=1 Tax=Batillaria attramentaria TaxID=370345 RepID=A0ABD0KGN8_9CAEN